MVYFIWVILNIDKNGSQIPPNVTQQKQQQQKPTKVPEKQPNQGKERHTLFKYNVINLIVSDKYMVHKNIKMWL